MVNAFRLILSTVLLLTSWPNVAEAKFYRYKTPIKGVKPIKRWPRPAPVIVTPTPTPAPAPAPVVVTPTPEPVVVTPAPAPVVVTPTPEPVVVTPAPSQTELTVYADGTARINAMLNASLNVSIPAGIYMITGALKLRDGHVVSAAQGAQVILKAADNYDGQIISLYYAKVTIRGLTLDGNFSKRAGLEANTYAALVNIMGGSDLLFENNKFQYAPSYGIYSAKSANLQIRGNTFFEVFFPIRVDGGGLESGLITKNTFKNTKAYKSFQHIEAIWTKDLVITHNTFEGASIGAEPNYTGILGTWGNSIFIHNSSDFTVENNKVYANYWAALVAGAETKRGIIRNNYFMGAGSEIAVWMEQPGSEYHVFENNEVDGGIHIGDNGANHFIIRNNIIRTHTVGIDVTFGAKNVLIEGNQFISTLSNRSNKGIYLFEKNTPDVDVRVINNSFKGFSEAISITNYLGQGSVYGIKLQGNTFENNKTNIYINPALKLMTPLGQN